MSLSILPSVDGRISNRDCGFYLFGPYNPFVLNDEADQSLPPQSTRGMVYAQQSRGLVYQQQSRGQVYKQTVRGRTLGE